MLGAILYEIDYAPSDMIIGEYCFKISGWLQIVVKLIVVVLLFVGHLALLWIFNQDFMIMQIVLITFRNGLYFWFDFGYLVVQPITQHSNLVASDVSQHND
jgi:hypothetical protein